MRPIYENTLGFLYSLQRNGIKWGLENIRALAHTLGDPQDKWPAIHIAGTNGKGSTAAILESILLKAGLKVGLYTSPHLVDFTERIRVNRQPIPGEEVIRFAGMIRPMIASTQPSFFEVTTAMAFWYFERQQIDIAIIETGMGGRLDSTNIVNPLISLITPISFDHQFYLGNTLEQIVGEKAGIIRPGIPCVTNNSDPAVLKVISNVAEERGSRLVKVNEKVSTRAVEMSPRGVAFELRWEGEPARNYFLNLPGSHQINNAALALTALRELPKLGPISEETICRGLQQVVWRGRIDLVSEDPAVIIDVSHNPAGFQVSFDFVLRYYRPEQITAVVFLQEDKDFRKIGELLARNTQRVLIVDLGMGKPLPPQILQNSIIRHGGTASIVPSLESIKEEMLLSRGRQELWLVIGSHYLAGAAYKVLAPLMSADICLDFKFS